MKWEKPRSSPPSWTLESDALSDRQAIIAFLENLVLFKLEEEDEAPAGAAAALQSLTGLSSPRQRVKIAPKGFRIRIEQGTR